MIKHSLMLLWARKRKNMMMIFQLAFSFFLLFGVFTILYDFYDNYQKPRGVNTENILLIRIEPIGYNPKSENAYEEVKKVYESMHLYLSNHPEVIRFGGSRMDLPFLPSWNTDNVILDSGKTHQYIRQIIPNETMELLDIKLVSGRMFNETDFDKDAKSLIVNELMYDAIKPYLNEKEQLLNGDGSLQYQIVGVVEGLKKRNDFEDPESFAFYPHNGDELFSVLLIKTKSDPTVLEAEIISELEKRCGNFRLSPYYFDDFIDAGNKEVYTPVILLCVISFFLVINIALGLYGVLWYNISQRTSEIGLRRALGADKSNISLQVLSEVLVLFVVAMLLGSIFAVQFPLLGLFNYSYSEYTVGAIFSFIFVGFITFFCGLYPSRLASQITPVEALREL